VILHQNKTAHISHVFAAANLYYEQGCTERKAYQSELPQFWYGKAIRLPISNHLNLLGDGSSGNRPETAFREIDRLSAA